LNQSAGDAWVEQGVTGRDGADRCHELLGWCLTMRLYLLAFQHELLDIELDDIDTAPGTLASLSKVAEKLRFRAS